MSRFATGFSRRSILAAGGLVLTFSLAVRGESVAQSASAVPPELRVRRRLDAWLRIAPDGSVTLLTGKVELGQGVVTAFSQMAADELDVPLERLTVISGDTALSPDEGLTRGSLSVQMSGMAVRRAAAEARHILLDLAAARLDVPAPTLVVRDGTVHAPDGRSVSYGALVEKGVLSQEATSGFPIKPADQRRYIGKPVPRLDLPAKVAGRAAFVQDHRPQGMVHGRVLRPPSYGATLAQVDVTAAERLPGVLKVVRDGSFLGVIATREDQAVAAVEALEEAARWDQPEAPPLTQQTIYDWLKAQDARELVIKDEARPAPSPARTVEAAYRRPYQMHGAIGPSAAVGLFEDGRYLIQTHTQGPFEARRAIAEMLRTPEENVRLQHMQGSGCYGHNGADDAAADAALLARAYPGVPVRVQWRRKDEHMWEPYGSAMLMEVRAGLDAKGDVLTWTYDLWSTPHATRPGGAGNLLPARMLAQPFDPPPPFLIPGPHYGPDRNAIALYDFPRQKVTTHFITEMPVRVSSLRSLGAYGNVFAIESFMDELAHAAGADPLAYRLRHLKDPRAAEALRTAAERFGWSRFKRRRGRGRGIAFARYVNMSAYCAVCLEVDLIPATGLIRVLRATAAVDVGETINPDGVANQIEGGVIQALSWSLKEEVRFENGRVLSDDWAGYPILKFSECPPVDVVLIDRPGEPAVGAGEVAAGPTAAALANAVFDAAGLRLRTLPFTPQRVKATVA